MSTKMRMVAFAAMCVVMACGENGGADSNDGTDTSLSVFQGTWSKCDPVVGPAFPPPGLHFKTTLMFIGNAFTCTYSDGPGPFCSIDDDVSRVETGTITVGAEVSVNINYVTSPPVMAVECDWHYEGTTGYDLCYVETTANPHRLYQGDGSMGGCGGACDGSTPAKRPTALYGAAFLVKE
jgi:hypothetical protein